MSRQGKIGPPRYGEYGFSKSAEKKDREKRIAEGRARRAVNEEEERIAKARELEIERQEILEGLSFTDSPPKGSLRSLPIASPRSSPIRPLSPRSPSLSSPLSHQKSQTPPRSPSVSSAPSSPDMGAPARAILAQKIPRSPPLIRPQRAGKSLLAAPERTSKSPSRSKRPPSPKMRKKIGKVWSQLLLEHDKIGFILKTSEKIFKDQSFRIKQARHAIPSGHPSLTKSKALRKHKKDMSFYQQLVRDHGVIKGSTLYRRQDGPAGYHAQKRQMVREMRQKKRAQSFYGDTMSIV